MKREEEKKWKEGGSWVIYSQAHHSRWSIGFGQPFASELRLGLFVLSFFLVVSYQLQICIGVLLPAVSGASPLSLSLGIPPQSREEK